ncbi:hypothetical protein CPB84DRAFT_1844124 [Gymnopilus junonius]|uniref:Uncharacterized protein n=1 Tax=Gymnopilus junonius TaxID=109634 RepID=A0A9P5NS10_GYMJU|nr:hypothetical protein CPB84DRAFT_1844124 [Gymnopilus junonius]
MSGGSVVVVVEEAGPEAIDRTFRTAHHPLAENPLSSPHPSLLQLFLVIVAIGLSGAVIVFHTSTVFSTPSSIVYISNLPALSSSCLAVASFLLHLVLAARTPPPKVTNEDSRFLPYKQYIMFGLVALTTIPNALSCAALFHRRDADHNRLVNVVRLVCLLHGFLVEALGKNFEVYRMKPRRSRTMRLARATVIVAVVLQALLLGSGAVCLFVIDFDYDILWLLPSLMLWTQFALSIVVIFFRTSKASRPLKLNVVFYGVTAVASLCLAAAGVALLVWASYRLMTVLHQILLTRDRGRDDVEASPGSNMASPRAMDIVGESTDEHQENDIPRNLDGKAFNPDGENIEMAEILRKPERIYQPGRPAPTASLSSDHASAMFATDSSDAILGHDRRQPSTTLLTRLRRALFARPHRRARTRARHENAPTESVEANGSIQSLDCSNVESEYKDDTFDTESQDQASMYVFPPSSLSLCIFLSNESDTEAAHRLPVLEKHDPTWDPGSPSSTSPVASTPMSKDESDYVVNFDALKRQVDQASRAIVSRHVEESDRRYREELLARRTRTRTLMPMPIDTTKSRVVEKSSSWVKANRSKSLAVLPVVSESSSDCEGGLE